MGGVNRIKVITAEPLKLTPRCRKYRYETHGEAARARRLVYRENRRNRSRGTADRVGELNVYFCTTCDGWHVGHKPGSRKR